MNTTKNTILLIVRLIAGILLVVAAYMKFADMSATVAFFATLGISAAVTWIVAIVEALAGLGLIFGACARTSAVGAIVIMIGTFVYTNMVDPKAVTVLVGAIIILFTGAGGYAVCKKTRMMAAGTKTTTTPVSSVPPSNPQM